MRKMVRDELRLRQAAIDAKDQVARIELEAAQTRLNAKLTRIEDLYLDGTWSRERFLERREGTQAELEAVKAQLAALPKVVRTDTDQLFAIADSLNGTPPDEEWREIVVEMVERVVIGETVEVEWKPLWQPVLTIPATATASRVRSN